MTAQEFNFQLTNMQTPLKRFAYSLTSDMEEAKDLLQETLLKALSNRDKFTNPVNFKSWLYTIMKNTFINNYRKNSRYNNNVDVSKDLFYLNTKEEFKSESPESVHATKEITKVIEGLENDYKTPFNMHVAGFKYKEIAEKLDIPIGSVKSRIFLARQKLMESLKDHRFSKN